MFPTFTSVGLNILYNFNEIQQNLNKIQELAVLKKTQFKNQSHLNT